MKTLLMVLVLLFTQVVSAEMPEYLEGGTVTVTLKNGKQYTFSSDEYMVARRDQAEVASDLAYLAGAAEQRELNAQYQSVAIQNALAAAEKPWRATVHAGVGSDGHSVKGDNNTVEVTERRAFVYGGSLGYKFHKDYSVTGTALSNQTYTLGFGKDF